ncbi:MAG: hypothetical protein ABH950_09935 [Candidatus Altiarchaeota archaeon]
MNAFQQLEDDLVSGKLSWTQVQIALRSSVRLHKDVPEGIKDLLCGKEGNAGLIYRMFKQIQEVTGAMELAYRRGMDFKEE